MAESAIYRLSSHDPLRGLGAQGADHLLVTSVADAERYVRNLYASVGAAHEVGPLRQIGDEPLWAMDASAGREWYIALAVVHQPDCPLLASPSDAAASPCICGPTKERR